MPDFLSGLVTIVTLFAALALCYVPLGDYIATVFTSSEDLWIEKKIYRLVKVSSSTEQTWPVYALSLVSLSFIGIVVLTLLLMLQRILPGDHPGIPWYGALNIAISFATNTNWQWYSGENTLNYLTQTLGLIVQNFISSAIGLTVAIVLIRGIARQQTDRLGNFWVDFVRATLRILFPIATIASIVLLSQGVIFSFSQSHLIHTITGGDQTLPGGIVAPQEAIKNLGTNGGGFFGANSAHPYENPNPFTNLVEIFLILLIPVSLPRTLGTMVKNQKQGSAVLAMMAIIFCSILSVITWAEVNAHDKTSVLAHGAYEGKETPFGIWSSALFTAASTATSTGAVNSSFDSQTPLANTGAIINILLGEIAPGGIGSGLYGVIIIIILTVFIAGLMVGRTPEFLGKKIGKEEMTWVTIYTLITPTIILTGLAICVGAADVHKYLADDSMHGFSELFYAFASTGNNNGSAYGGVDSSGPFLTLILSIVMLIGRYIPMISILALAAFLAKQKKLPVTSGTLPTHGPLFIGFTICIAFVLAGVNYIPALALGPIAEALL